ncbi:hypothetical protein VNO80_13140 [Phaseolus coccineus]|uniref:Uncharacterized protein n=1 Tax=Phaseolus coccineus TaxID=3886 RepID=A0AAN9R6S0_PHACN
MSPDHGGTGGTEGHSSRVNNTKKDARREVSGPLQILTEVEVAKETHSYSGGLQGAVEPTPMKDSPQTRIINRGHCDGEGIEELAGLVLGSNMNEVEDVLRGDNSRMPMRVYRLQLLWEMGKRAGNHGGDQKGE